MTDQGQLFETAPINDPYNGLWHPQRPLVPAPIGSGPSDKRCRECDHCRRVHHHDKIFAKCWKMERHWSNGQGTDIRVGWTACREFVEREGDYQVVYPG